MLLVRLVYEVRPFQGGGWYHRRTTFRRPSVPTEGEAKASIQALYPGEEIGAVTILSHKELAPKKDRSLTPILGKLYRTAYKIEAPDISPKVRHLDRVTFQPMTVIRAKLALSKLWGRSFQDFTVLGIKDMPMARQIVP